MPDPRLSELLDAFFGGELDEASRAELAKLLESDPEAQREFDAALRGEALLLAEHAPVPPGRRSAASREAAGAGAAVPSRRLDELLDAWVCGGLDEAGRAELAGLVESDAESRRAFDAALREEALLVAAHAPVPVAASQRPAPNLAQVRPLPVQPAGRSFWRARRAAVAALLACTVGAVAWLSWRETGAIVVEAGSVLVDGHARRLLSEGARFGTIEAETARLAFPDGVRAEFSFAEVSLPPAVPPARRIVRLESGRGRFKTPEGYGRFEVQTPIGVYASLGTRFSVDLRHAGLDLKVEHGIVRASHLDRAYLVSAGEARRFGGPVLAELPPALRGLRAMLHGVVERAFDGEAAGIRVTEVYGALPGGKAGLPRLPKNQLLRVAPGEVEKNGAWRRLKPHEDFLRALSAGQDFSMAVAHQRDDLCALVFLPKALGKHFNGQCGCKDQHQ